MTWWAALVLLIGLTAAIRRDRPFAIDRSASLAIRRLSHPACLPLPHEVEASSGIIALWRSGDRPTAIAKLISLFGNDVGWTAASLLAIVLGMVLAGRRRLGLTLLVVDTSADLSNQVFQYARGRQRPAANLMPIFYQTPKFGFPSGHTVHYTVVCCFILWWLSRVPRRRIRLRCILIALALLTASMIVAVGWSRIYLGAHWITDVLAGYLYGYVWFRLGVGYLKKGRLV